MATTGGGRPVTGWIDLGGPVRYLDFGGPAGAPPAVAVHGLGGAGENWMALGPRLVHRYRVLALDLVGFGLTRASGRPTTVAAHTDLALRFAEEVGGGPALWLGNSMGALVTLQAVVRRPDLARGAVLLDPALMPAARHRRNPLTMAMFAAYLAPGVGRAVVAGRRRVRTPEQSVQDTLRFCCADPRRVEPEVVEAHVDMVRERMTHPDLGAQFVQTTRSLMATVARRRRLFELAAAVSVPVLMVHGDRDRLVPLAAAADLARRRPDWTFVVARGVGHIPQLEVPEWTARQILAWDDAAAVSGAA